MPTPAEIANLFPKIGGPLRSQAEAEGLASSVANYAAIKSDAHGTKQLLRAEDVVDGDTTRFGRTTGFDTFESTIGSDNNEKAKKLLDLGITVEQQRSLGGQGKQVLTDYLTKNPGVVADITGHDVYGRQLLSSPQLTEHMIASGVAVPTDRYDEKLQGLYRKTQEKINKLDPARGKAMEIQREYNIEGQKPGFFERVGDAVDAFQSGTQQAVVGTADFALDLLTPGGDNKLLNDLKSAKTANKMWGYDSREADFAKQEALHKFKNEEYGGAVLEMVKSPELWGESLPMMAEMMLGAGKFTKLGKMISAETAGLQGAEKVAKIKDLKDKASVYDRVKHMAAGNVGYLATIGDQTNRHIEAFTENNEGVPPSYAQIAEMTAVNALQLGLDRFAFKEAFGLKGGVSKFKDNIKPLVDTVTPENIPSVVKSIAASSAGIATAMGTEAAQEYVQTWAEMLNEKAGTKKYGDWLAVLQNPEAQDEAIIGALAGAGMGAQMRGATEVVSGLTSDKRQEMIDAIKNRQNAQQVVEPSMMEGLDVQESAGVAPTTNRFKAVTEVLDALDKEEGTNHSMQFKTARNILSSVKDTGLGENSDIRNSLDVIKANQDLDRYYRVAGVERPVSEKENNLVDSVSQNVKNLFRGRLQNRGFDALDEEGKFQVIQDEMDIWAQEKDVEIDGYRNALIYPLAELILEGKSFGSAETPITFSMEGIGESVPEGKAKPQGVSFTMEGAKPAPKQTKVEAKETVRNTVKQKMYEDANLQVDEAVTDTHTGISKRSINKLAEVMKVPAAQVQAALHIAAEGMMIKRMGNVSKEANETQYNIYHGKDGILPNYIKFKKALQDGDENTATEAWNSLQKRYVDQAYKGQIALDAIKEVQSKVLEMYEAGKDIAEIQKELGKTTVGVQGAKSGDIVGRLTINDVIKLTEELPKELRDSVQFSESGHIVEAEIESAQHIAGIAQREGIALPKVEFKKVERASLYSLAAKKAREIQEQLDELEKASSEVFGDMTKEELKDHAELDGKVKALKKSLEKHKKDMQKQVEFAKTSDYQYTNTTFKEDVDVSSKVGQKVGTVTTKQAEELGIDEKFIEEFVPTKTENEYKKVLAEIKELKKERAKLQVGKREVDKKVKAHDTKVESLDKELANAEAVLGVTAVAPVKQAVEAAKKADGVVQKLADKIRSLKTVKKDLEAAEKFLAKNAEVFGSMVVDVQDLVRTQKAFNEWLKSPEGRKSSKEAQNAKIVELSKMSDTLHTITNAAIRMAKASVVFARRLMNLQGIKNDTNLVSAVKESLDKVNRDLVNAEARLQAVKGQRAVNVQDAIKKVLDLRKGIVPEIDEVLDKKELKEVLQDATTLRKLKNKLYRVKGGSKEVIKKLSEEIKEKEASLRGNALYKGILSDNLAMLKNGALTLTHNWQFESLLNSKGSILANLPLDKVANMFDEGSTAAKYLTGIVSKSQKLVDGALYTDAIGKREIIEDRLSRNPALMLLANVELVDDQYRIVYKPEMINALRLVTRNYLAINESKLSFNVDLAISKLIGVSEYDWKAIRNAREVLKDQGQLLTVVATRIGEDFASSMGIKQGKVGEEEYRKLIADLGNTALVLAEQAREIEFKYLDGVVWKDVAGKQIEKGAKVKFVHIGKQQVRSTKNELETLKEINKALDILNQQSTYRIQPINAVQNEKKYKVDGSPFEVPQESQEVLRVLEDQEYEINVPAMEAILEAYRNDREGFMARSGWVNTDSILLKDDRDAQESKNREIEDVMEKLEEMMQEYNDGALSDGVFFNWFFSSNGRYMIDAVGINPQADKHITRWVLLPKEAVNAKWDMDDKNVAKLAYDGIAQAFGWDIDKTTPAETEVFAKSIIEEYNNDSKKFTEGVQSGKLEIGGKVVKMPHPGHAFIAVEFLKAMQKGSKFRGTMVAEYDAKTSGPMHKLMQWPVLKDENGKDITEEWFEKGAIMQGDKELRTGNSAGHSGAITDGYQTVTVEAGKVLDSKEPVVYNKDGSIKVDYSKPFEELKTMIAPLVNEDGSASKEGRALGKQAFVPFGYGSSVKSIQENIGITLAYEILRRVADPKDTQIKEVMEKAFPGIRYSHLQHELQNEATSKIKGNDFRMGVGKGNPLVIDMLAEMFNITYGEAYKEAMESKFSEHVAINNAIREVTSSMFRVWKMRFDAEIAKEPNATTDRKMEIIANLEEAFPLIKAPWSLSRDEGVAIYDTKRASMKNESLPKVETLVRGDKSYSTASVQAMITELDEVYAAGAVLPIHWIDGSQIGTILKEGGVQGIHDAIVLGIPTEEGIDRIKRMNKAMYDINANYNLMEEFKLSFNVMLDSMTDKEIEMFAEQDNAMNLADVKETLDNIVANVNEARAKVYSQPMVVGNIISFEGTEYSNKEDLAKYSALDSVINKILEGCK